MHAQVTTTITTMINLDTMEPSHSVNIEAEDGLPAQVAYAVAEGAARTLLAQLEGRRTQADDA
jgi:hypothetical protein